MSLPIVDISSLRQNGGSISVDVASAIRQAYMEYGFFYITGHGIPNAIIDAATDTAMRFFRLSLENKRRVSANINHRGWACFGRCSDVWR